MRSSTRREFLGQATATLASVGWLAQNQGKAQAADERPRLKVAAIITEFSYRSHAHVILENFLKPYLFNGEWTDSGCDVVAMYIDQFPEGRDMARGVSAEFGIPIYATIGEAVRAGGKELGVDGVLSIAEHGDYPHNELGQQMYPRKRFFDEIVAVYRQSGRVAPLFNDKHLSFRWDWAREMYDTARELKIPLMAGSSVPLAERRPPQELKPGEKLARGVSIHGGGLESYDFHGLEVLQSMVESRAGGERGVESVQLLEGEKLWQAGAAGEWPVELARAAMVAELGAEAPGLKEIVTAQTGDANKVHGILACYRDGFQGTVLAIGGQNRWNFACERAGKSEPLATSFYVGPWVNRNLFKALSHAIQTHFRQRQAPFPVERTLLTTGMVDAAMHSHHEAGRVIETPHLAIEYQPVDFRAMREMGATWKLIPEGTPEPPGIDPGGRP
ncbi:MAG: hypothetical protein K1X71_12740 [Pirellulales bacterium]|nr:hypothetical protein [Pirellulales bacterium]